MKFVDVTGDFIGSPEKLFLHRDPLHQNAIANRIIAGRLFDEIRGQVAR